MVSGHTKKYPTQNGIPSIFPSTTDKPLYSDPSLPPVPMMLTTPFRANCIFLTGAIERFGKGVPEMYALTAERGLKAPDFEDIKIFLVTLWRPSAITAHDTDHDADHDTDHDRSTLTE